MNLINRLGLIVVLLLFFNAAHSQEIEATKYKSSLNSGLYLGAAVSTNGWGFNARYAFNDWFSLKTGYETLSLSYSFDFDEYDVEYKADLDFKTGGILALADFSYTRNLYISTGIIFTSFNPKVTGYAISDYQYGDITISADDIGSFKFEAEPGLKVSPYIGAGYQAFFGKRDGVVFNFETGFYYMGAPDFTIEADGLLAPTADPAFGQTEYLESQFDAYKIYPVIKLNLAFKLF
ncbi:hypothetical protein OU798_19330 [Prolixibacteraceae bacterium Z1-6]|uniref:Outer membrane protein beta-barrel domain-containing protein n=1 Tax=Draconibacterium aestuarii TaxID=2998507 RepID=A0A9X3F8G6_9BACT|nr:hypothetical protein [Prolixibacteraceae bacterium Z1-6]